MAIQAANDLKRVVSYAHTEVLSDGGPADECAKTVKRNLRIAIAEFENVWAVKIRHHRRGNSQEVDDICNAVVAFKDEILNDYFQILDGIIANGKGISFPHKWRANRRPIYIVDSKSESELATLTRRLAVWISSNHRYDLDNVV